MMSSSMLSFRNCMTTSRVAKTMSAVRSIAGQENQPRSNAEVLRFARDDESKGFPDQGGSAIQGRRASCFAFNTRPLVIITPDWDCGLCAVGNLRYAAVTSNRGLH